MQIAKHVVENEDPKKKHLLEFNAILKRLSDALLV